MTASDLRQPSSRIDQLDALRGVAALIVVFSHLLLLVQSDPRWAAVAPAVPMMLFARPAVIFFFVLSGFVLAQGFIAGKERAPLGYAAHRLARLYPLVLVSILLSAAGLIAFGPCGSHCPSSVARETWGLPVDGGTFARHLLLLGWPDNAVQLNTPMWSLIIELRASILMPLLVPLTLRAGWWSVPLAAASTLVATKLGAVLGDAGARSASTAFGSMLLTLRFLGFFSVGILCAGRTAALSRIFARWPDLAHVALIAACFVLMAGLLVSNRFYTGLSDVFYGLMSAYTLMLALTSRRFASILCSKSLVKAGWLSFSLYITHWPMTMFVTALFGERLSALPLAVISFFVSIAVAWVLRVTVEGPTASWSKRVGRGARYLIKPVESTGSVPGAVKVVRLVENSNTWPADA